MALSICRRLGQSSPWGGCSVYGTQLSVWFGRVMVLAVRVRHELHHQQVRERAKKRKPDEQHGVNGDVEKENRRQRHQWNQATGRQQASISQTYFLFIVRTSLIVDKRLTLSRALTVMHSGAWLWFSYGGKGFSPEWCYPPTTGRILVNGPFCASPRALPRCADPAQQEIIYADVAGDFPR